MEPTTSGLQVPTKLGLSVSHESLLCTDSITPPFPSLESSRSHNSLVKNEPSDEKSPRSSGPEFTLIPQGDSPPLDQNDPALLPPTFEQTGPDLSHEAALHKLSIRPRRTHPAKRKVVEKEVREDKILELPLIVDENGNADPSLAERPKIKRLEGEIDVAKESGQKSTEESGLSKAEEIKALIPEYEALLPSIKKDISRALSPSRGTKTSEPIPDEPSPRLEENLSALPAKEEPKIGGDSRKNTSSEKNAFLEQSESSPLEIRSPQPCPSISFRRNELETIYTAQPCKIEEIGDETVILIPELPKIEEIKQEKITTHTEPPKTEFQVTTVSKIADHTAFVVSPTKGVTTSKGKTLVHTSALLLPNEETKSNFKIQETVRDDKKETLVIKFEENNENYVDKSSALENVCIERTDNSAKSCRNQTAESKPIDFQVKCNSDRSINFEASIDKTSKQTSDIIPSSPKVPLLNFEYTNETLPKCSGTSGSDHLLPNSSEQINATKKNLDAKNLSPTIKFETDKFSLKASEHEMDPDKEDKPQNINNQNQNGCPPTSSLIKKDVSPVLSLVHNPDSLAKENKFYISDSENIKSSSEEVTKDNLKESSLSPNKQDQIKPSKDFQVNSLSKESKQPPVPVIEKTDKNQPNVIRRTTKPVSVEIIPFNQRIKDPTFIAAPKGWRHSTDLSFTKSSFVEGIVKKMDTNNKTSQLKDEPKPERHSFQEKITVRSKSPEIALTTGLDKLQATKCPEESSKPAKLPKIPSQWEVRIQHHHASNHEREANEKIIKPSPPIKTDNEPELLRVFARRSIKHKSSERSLDEYESIDFTEPLNEVSKRNESKKSISDDSLPPDNEMPKAKEICHKESEIAKQSQESNKEHDMAKKKRDAEKNTFTNNIARNEISKSNDKTKIINETTVPNSEGAFRKSKDATLNNQSGIKFSIISSNPDVTSSEKDDEVNKNKFENTKSSFQADSENRKSDLIKNIDSSQKVKENQPIPPATKPVKPKQGLPKAPKPAVLSPKPQIPNKSLNQNEKLKWRSHHNSINRIDQLNDTSNCKNEASVILSNSKPLSKNEEKVQRTNSFSPSISHGPGDNGTNDSAQTTTERGKESPGAPSWLQLAHQRRELRVQRERLLLGSTSPSFVLEGSGAKPPRSSKVWSMVSNIQKLQMT